MGEETDRVTVSTYVPAYQRERWKADADRLDMSQSEFVRSMVQAGRRGFFDDDSTTRDDRTAAEPAPGDATPGGDGMKEAILGAIERDGPLDWEELVDELIGDAEEDLENALDELQDENRVRYSGRRGGYRLVGGTDGE